MHSSSDMTVTVDPRIELLSVVWKMSGYGRRRRGRISRDSSPYSMAVARWFRRYAEHEAINYFRENGHTLAGDLPVALILQLSSPPELEWRVSCDPILASRAGGGREVRRFADVLRAFARDTAFDDFFRAKKKYFGTIAVGPRRALRAGGCIENLEVYMGAQLRGYYVILAPLLKSIAFGPCVRLQDGGLEAYGVLPAWDVAGERITFQTGPAARSILLHEFTHSFVNPLVERHRKHVAQFAPLMRRINYKTGAAYGMVWEICVGEHIVRAITTRISAGRYGEAKARKEVAVHEKKGFLFTGALCDRLRTYERRRDVYPSLASFFPVLLDLFGEVCDTCPEHPAEKGRKHPKATPQKKQ